MDKESQIALMKRLGKCCEALSASRFSLKKTEGFMDPNRLEFLDQPVDLRTARH